MDGLLVQIVARRKLFILRSQYTTGGRRSVKYIKAKSGTIILCCILGLIKHPILYLHLGFLRGWNLI